MTAKCGWRRGGPSPSPATCPERPLPNKTFCKTHMQEAMARVATVRDGDRPRKWPMGWMVAGSSRE